MFPRLEPGQRGSVLSDLRRGSGIPRLKSPTGGRGAGERKPGQRGERLGPGRPQDPGRLGGQNVPGERNAPPGNPEGGNDFPKNANDALGNGDELLRDKVENPLNDPDLGLNPGDRRPNELDQNEPAGQPPGGNDPNNPAGDARHGNRNPPNQAGGEKAEPPGNRAPQGNVPNAGGPEPPQQAGDQLPAPTPREPSANREPSRVGRPTAGTFAQVVGAAFHLLAWTVLAVICSLIVWLIIKAIRDFDRLPSAHVSEASAAASMDLPPAQAPGDVPADIYVAQARMLAEQGRYREAVVQLLLGAMSQVERAGWVRFRRGMTVRDYLKAVRGHRGAYQGLHAIVRVFEPLTFGRRAPTQDHFEKSLKGYETGFGVD